MTIEREYSTSSYNCVNLEDKTWQVVETLGPAPFEADKGRGQYCETDVPNSNDRPIPRLAIVGVRAAAHIAQCYVAREGEKQHVSRCPGLSSQVPAIMPSAHQSAQIIDNCPNDFPL